MRRILAFLPGALALAMAGAVVAEESDEGLPVMTPEQMETFQFEPIESEPPVVMDLNVGQRAIMSQQRRSIRDLIARRLGVLSLKGDRSDLSIIQRVIDRGLIRDDEVREWQALGVVYGDVLAKEFDMHWVSYEDEQGASKALRWRDTSNFLFPVTMFSKRVYFDEDIDAEALTAELAETVTRFKRFESLKPR